MQGKVHTANYTGFCLQRVKDARKIVRYKWVLVVTGLFNIAINDFNVKKSARYSQVFVVAELVTSGTQCNTETSNHRDHNSKTHIQIDKEFTLLLYTR